MFFLLSKKKKKKKRVIPDGLFLRKFVFGVSVFCFICVVILILRILKNLRFQDFCAECVRDGLMFFSSPDVTLCGRLDSKR